MPVPKTEIIGNAVDNAKVGYDKNGKAYCFVRVACSDSRKLQDNSWETIREIFINVQAFGVDDQMHIPLKGDRVMAYGKIYNTEDQGNDGTVYHNTNLQADFIRAFPKQQQSQGGFGGQQQSQGQQGNAQYGNRQQQGASSNDPWNSAPPASMPDDEPPF